jgi:hypothetical protein
MPSGHFEIFHATGIELPRAVSDDAPVSRIRADIDGSKPGGSQVEELGNFQLNAPRSEDHGATVYQGSRVVV